MRIIRKATMLAVASVSYALTSVALFAARGGRRVQAFAWISLGLACVAGFEQWGPLIGSVVLLVIGMVSTSILVLVLPPRPELARPIAYATGVLGTNLWLTHWALGLLENAG